MLLAQLECKFYFLHKVCFELLITVIFFQMPVKNQSIHIWILELYWQKQPPEVFYKKTVPKNFAIFTENYLIGVSFLIITFIKKRLQHRCFPISIAKFSSTLIFGNICERLLLYWWGLIVILSISSGLGKDLKFKEDLCQQASRKDFKQFCFWHCLAFCRVGQIKKTNFLIIFVYTCLLIELASNIYLQWYVENVFKVN